MTIPQSTDDTGYVYPVCSEKLSGKLVNCYGCGATLPDTKGMWSRSGRLFLCGPECPGTRQGKDEGTFRYFREWVRRETPGQL